MNPDQWQEDAIQRVTSLLSRDEDVLGLVLVGSHTRDDIATDIWSDVDLVVVVRDEALERFWPAEDWLSALGDVFCTSQNSAGDWHVTRVYCADCPRIDFVIATESSLARIEEWDGNPLGYVNVCLFSRSPELDRALSLTFPPPVPTPVSPEDFERMANDFWFKGMLAVSKVGRKELLVALHLSLDMIRDCLVLGMMLRDRETGTDHHRDGTQGNDFVSMLDRTRQPYTALGILDSIEQSAIVFDKLAACWDRDYEEHRCPLLNWIARARESLSEIQ